MGRNYIELYQRRENHCAMAPLMLELPWSGKQVILMIDTYTRTLIFLDIYARTWLLMQSLTSEYTGEWYIASNGAQSKEELELHWAEKCGSRRFHTQSG